ncbi:MAG TPA: hypothetical protein VGR43_02330 [Dehalococcoidia bacterium]|nr:hypothetical protein [Dehalococcoidia bacterium]
MRKPFISFGLALGIFALTGAGAALAHECYNASRSAQGNEGANHSPVWETIDLELLASDVGLDEAQTEAFLAAADEAGVPFSVTIFVGKKTIGENGAAYTEGDNATDGKGIDYFFTKYGETLFGILCGEIDPDNPECSGPPA